MNSTDNQNSQTLPYMTRIAINVAACQAATDMEYFAGAQRDAYRTLARVLATYNENGEFAVPAFEDAKTREHFRTAILNIQAFIGRETFNFGLIARSKKDAVSEDVYLGYLGARKLIDRLVEQVGA